MRTSPLEQGHYAANVAMNRKNRQIEVCLVSARAIWIYFRCSRAPELDGLKILAAIGRCSHATMVIKYHFKLLVECLNINYEFVIKV